MKRIILVSTYNIVVYPSYNSKFIVEIEIDDSNVDDLIDNIPEP